MNETIQEFKLRTDDKFRDVYIQSLISNLSHLNIRESKTFILVCLITLMYMLIQTKAINEIDLGFFKIENTDILIAYFPIVFIYSLFQSYSISFQINETRKILEELLEKELLFEICEKNNIKSTRFSRAFFPYSFASSIGKLGTGSRNIALSVIGFAILLPVIIIGLLPYAILAYMLTQTYSLGFDDYFISIAFGCTIWGIILLLFMVIIKGLENK